MAHIRTCFIPLLSLNADSSHSEPDSHCSFLQTDTGIQGLMELVQGLMASSRPPEAKPSGATGECMALGLGARNSPMALPTGLRALSLPPHWHSSLGQSFQELLTHCGIVAPAAWATGWSMGHCLPLQRGRGWVQVLV